ncbi:MAG: c-type cytochrome biogenesis protein CcmI [Methylococcaceae bacterium]
MITFLLIALLILLLGYLFFVPAWRGNGNTPPKGRDQLNWALHLERQADLAQEGTLAEELDRLTHESERNLLDDLDQSETAVHGKDASKGRRTLLTALILIPLLGGLLYLKFGRPELLENPPQAAQESARVAIKALASRLTEKPDDLEGWILLGRSLQTTERPEEAAKAFEMAMKLAPEDLDIQVSLAESLAEAQDGRLQGRPIEMVRKILQKNPKHKLALWLSGLESAQSGDTQSALKSWQQLRAEFTPGSDEAIELEGYLHQLDPNAASSTQGDQKPQGTSIRVRVTLAKELAAKADPNDTVFIFAKAAEGPPMPLAVVRKIVRDLPIEVQLDDSMSMMAGMNLSKFERLLIGARISKSGRPVASSGDLEGLSEPVTPSQGAHYDITIQRVIP